MDLTTAAACLCGAVLLVACSGHASAESQDDWIAKIRPDHPRLFINADLWPEVKARALGSARSYYDSMKKRVDGYPDEPEGSSGGAVVQQEERIAGRVVKMPKAAPAKEWGPQAMETAFVYLMTGDRKYLERARRMLEVSIEVYDQCYKELRAVNWYSTTRV